MKNKKILIIAVVVMIVLAILFGALKIRSSYLFNEDGTLSDGHAELIEQLRSIEDEERRKEQIDFALESNIITQEEANSLY